VDWADMHETKMLEARTPPSNAAFVSIERLQLKRIDFPVITYLVLDVRAGDPGLNLRPWLVVSSL